MLGIDEKAGRPLVGGRRLVLASGRMFRCASGCWVRLALWDTFGYFRVAVVACLKRWVPVNITQRKRIRLDARSADP